MAMQMASHVRRHQPDKVDAREGGRSVVDHSPLLWTCIYMLIICADCL